MKFVTSVFACLLLTLGSRHSLRCAWACPDHDDPLTQARGLAGSEAAVPRQPVANATSRTLQEFQTLRVNCGSTKEVIGSDGQTWVADTNYRIGGYSLEKSRQGIEPLPKVPMEVFQSMRRSMAFSSSFTYEFEVPIGEYTVAFYFAELVYDAVDERVFVIKMEDVVKFDNVDIVELAGGQFKGVQLARKTFVSDGVLTLEFINVKGNAAISGLKIIRTKDFVPPIPNPDPTLVPTTAAPVGSQPTTTEPPISAPATESPTTAAPIPSPAPVGTAPPVVSTPTDVSFEPILINAGGEAYTDLMGRQWQEDRHFTGGNPYSRDSPISNTEDDVIYTSERMGDFSYRFEVPVATYEVILHFAEVIFTQRNGRLFTIKIQNEIVHNNIDLFVLSEGQPFKAFTLESTEIVSDGNLLIEFVSSDRSVPKINGIEKNGAVF